MVVASETDRADKSWNIRTHVLLYLTYWTWVQTPRASAKALITTYSTIHVKTIESINIISQENLSQVYIFFFTWFSHLYIFLFEFY